MTAPDLRTRALLDSGAALTAGDPALAWIAARLPPLEPRLCPPGVAGLVWMVIGQQVSTVSARAVWTRLCGTLGGEDAVTAEGLLALSDEEYRRCGFSRQKAGYARAIALAGGAGGFDRAALAALDDEAAVAALVAVKGVGRWTAETFLMMGEGRPDLFPAGDIALQETVRWLHALPARPDAAETARRAARWAPHRSAAAHLLWAWYVAVKAGELAHPLAAPASAPAAIPAQAAA